MDAKTFLEKHGRETTRQVCEAAETSIEYFSQIAYGHRRPSVDLAKKLTKASEEAIADKRARLDVVSLLGLKEKAA
ncbi:MAG TPA: hypothetical protein VF516_03330 [Kofleriaceae bacterium]